MGKCLLVSPVMFGYEKNIYNELCKHFDEVIFIDERIGNSTYKKTLSRFVTSLSIRNPLRKPLEFLKSKYVYEKYKKHMDDISDLDVFICIVPETIPNWFIERVKTVNPNIKMILYMWDSFSVRPYVLEKIHFFDNVFTFDDVDAINYGINHLPLFYNDTYTYNETDTATFYEFSFVGTAHSDRYIISKRLSELVIGRSYIFLFLQSKLQYYFLKLTNKSFKNAKLSEFVFSSISSKEIISIVEKSKAILDIEHPNQKGLTMRTIEIALGLRKKLITTNKNIEKYDFYNENNILIIDRDNFDSLDVEFFQQDYTMLSEDIYKKYSLENWVKILIKHGEIK